MNRDNYPSNIEAPQKLYIEYSHDISFDYSTGRYPDGTESQWHWESNYIPITHKINGLEVGRHEWMRIKVGEPAFWTYPIRMSANITNIQTVTSEIDEGTGEFDFIIKLTFEDGSIKESDPITIKNGVDGVEIVSSVINNDGYLIITYSDGRVENAGMAKGSDATGIPITGPNDYVLSISGNIPVWIMPLQVLNAALTISTPLTYDINTGNLSITKADTNTSGYLSYIDWNIFNEKQDVLVADIDYVTPLALSNAYYNKTELQTSGLSLIHWDNITNIPSLGATYVFDNGLTEITDNIVKLGGIISNDIIFDDSRSIPLGLQYASDYSLTFDNRSLVDKEYVDTQISNISIPNVGSGSITENPIISGESIINIINGSNRLFGIDDLMLSINKASSTENGYLSSTDWNRFDKNSIGITLTKGSIISYLSGIKIYIENDEILTIPQYYDYNTYSLNVDGIVDCIGTINYM